MIKISNRIIVKYRTPVFFGNDSLSKLEGFITLMRPSQVFILADSNTKIHCLPQLTERCPSLGKALLLETIAGEGAKSFDQAVRIWTEMNAAGADRSSVLINLGGGTISDLGGFIAAGYQRGVRYINIPTTLMGQADAAIGGKTAVNLGHIKNQVGFFHAAAGIFIVPEFLKTLPPDHLRSGFAEIIKCTLIGNEKLWRRIAAVPLDEILSQPVEGGLWTTLVSAAVKFKNHIVMQDFHERNLRKILNFGHTIGHALEGYSIKVPDNQLLHGDAVAAGMICAIHLSKKKTGLHQVEVERIVGYLHRNFPRFQLAASHNTEIADLLLHDKKSREGKLLFTLISAPGKPICNVRCSAAEVGEALTFYAGLDETWKQ